MLSNQQPSWHEHAYKRNPVRRVMRSKSLDMVAEQVERTISGIKHSQFQHRKQSLSAKSETACISPTKSTTKYSINSGSENHEKSPTSVLDLESTESVLRDSSATMSTVSQSLRSLKEKPVIEIEGCGEDEKQDIDLESSYLLDLGSIPSSFRLSSSNFSTRSDITGPTLCERPNESSIRATGRTQPDSRRSLLTSSDSAPLRPMRRTSANHLSSGFSYGGNSSLDVGRQGDHSPTKPCRQSSRRMIPGDNCLTAQSIATNISTDSSPCKPIRQKSVAVLLEKTASNRAKLQCPSIDSSPPAKPQRKHSIRSLVSLGSNSDDAVTTHLQHQSMRCHESILEEASLSEHCD